jgi:hypothetical protein
VLRAMFVTPRIRIPRMDRTLGPDCFDGCGSLSSLVFEPGSHLHRFNACDFQRCWSLTTLSIPSLTTDVLLSGAGPPALSTVMFDGPSQVPQTALKSTWNVHTVFLTHLVLHESTQVRVGSLPPTPLNSLILSTIAQPALTRLNRTQTKNTCMANVFSPRICLSISRIQCPSARHPPVSANRACSRFRPSHGDPAAPPPRNERGPRPAHFTHCSQWGSEGPCGLSHRFD